MTLISAAIQASMTSFEPQMTEKLTLQTVYDSTADETERKRIRRIYDFFLKPLAMIDGEGDLLAWFDENFPPVKTLGARSLPGADRKFWATKEAYAKWREVVRRRIRTATGEIATEKAVRARIDDWTPLLKQLKAMTEDGGPVHVAQYGAISAFADLARKHDLEPLDLSRSQIETLLGLLPNHHRESAIKALSVLDRLKIHRSIAQFLPADFNGAGLRASALTEVPENIRLMISEMLDKGQNNKGTYDDISESYRNNFNSISRKNYSAALIALARAAADTRSIELHSLNSLRCLFDCDTRRAVIAHWTEQAKNHNGICASTAAGYVRTIIQFGEANGMNMEQWRLSRKNNPFLVEGKEKKAKMADKNLQFCRDLMSDPKKIKKFLSQHVVYQEAAKRILAKGEDMTDRDRRDVRRLGTCALYAAICVRGAAIRKGSALSILVDGAKPNLLQVTVGDRKHYEIRFSKQDVKGEYVELPPIPVRDDKYCGYEVVHWFLNEIRPLFNHANPEWCEHNNCERTPYLFPSEKSDRPLAGSLLYKWIAKSSHLIGIPMRPHNFRHGFATLLLSKSWGNKERAAGYLGCTPQVIEKHYAWINKRQKLEETQDLLAEYLAG